MIDPATWTPGASRCWLCDKKATSLLLCSIELCEYHADRVVEELFSPHAPERPHLDAVARESQYRRTQKRRKQPATPSLPGTLITLIEDPPTLETR